MDPYSEVREELEAWLIAHPGGTAKALFQELQRRYPGRFPDVQLRTLQRRVAEWRARAVLTFDDGWLAEERLGAQALPRPLRAVPLADTPAATAAGGCPKSADGLVLPVAVGQ